VSTQELHTGISDIRLYTDESYLYVEVKAVGIWYEVIRERRDSSSIDHFVTAGAIRAMQIELRAEDTARRRTQGAKDGWEIRRNKKPV
jgi:hypothetical protein